MQIERMLLMPGLLLATVGLALLGGCDQLKNENARLTQENTALRAELGRARAALDATVNERDSLVAELQRRQEPAPAPAPAASAITRTGFEQIEGTQSFRQGNLITVRVPGEILFASGRATLRTSAKRTLGQIANVLKDEHDADGIRVEGHTDTDKIKKSQWRDNGHLSEARAGAVRDHLASLGVSKGQMEIIGHGPRNPVASNKTRSGKAKNRRVEIIVETRQ